MNILILGGKSYVSSANIVCVRNMAREYVKRGDKVCIVISGEKDSVHEESIDGYVQLQVRRSWYLNFVEKISKKEKWFWRYILYIISIFRYFFMMPLYPNVSPITSSKLYKLAKKIVNDKKIDLIIGTYGGYENIYASTKLKKRLKQNIQIALYYLDLCTASDNKYGLIRSYTELSIIKCIARQSNLVDKILIPFSGQERIEKEPRINKEVINYVGFPVFIPMKCDKYECSLPFSPNRVEIVYIGSLSKQNRNPNYVLSVFERASVAYNLDVRLHFWGSINEMSIKQRIQDSNIAEYHGIIDNRYTQYIMSKSDFLLNIGNTLSVDMLPSKIFSLFSIKKPIVNVINSLDDVSQKYLELYKNTINIKGYLGNIDDDIRVLVEGLVKLNGKEIEMDPKLFNEFTPSYICDIACDA